MMFMTAKVDLKKTLLAIAAAAAVILALIFLISGNSGSNAPSTTTSTVASNDARVEFLKGFGWEVSASPAESGQVRIPQSSSPVYDRYNDLQKSQGYDLSQYAGKTVMRYVYKITNYPGATDPVYATVLVYKNQIIGGDIANTSAKGNIHGFQLPASLMPPETTVPGTTTE